MTQDDAPREAEPAAAPASVASRTRTRYALAAALALVVTAVFLTVGDGVPSPATSGWRRLVVEAGHVAVWALLGVAFGIAALRGRWTGASRVLAVGAGVVYAVFLAAVLLPGS